MLSFKNFLGQLVAVAAASIETIRILPVKEASKDGSLLAEVHFISGRAGTFTLPADIALETFAEGKNGSDRMFVAPDNLEQVTPVVEAGKSVGAELHFLSGRVMTLSGANVAADIAALLEPAE